MASRSGVFVLVVLCSVILAGRASADVCDSNPCQNEGRCRTYSWSENYFCSCTRPYFGRSCEKVSPCISGNPCKNGGSCGATSFSPGYYCNCPSTHVGKNCEKENPCLKNQTCQNGGTCYTSRQRDEGYYCSCRSGYGGNKCQLMNPCKSSPCQNGGSCDSYVSYGPVEKYNYYCRCTNMYNGNHCEHASECQTKICYNGGTCYTYEDGEAMCRCADGFRGPTCQWNLCPVTTDVCQSRHWETYDFSNCTASMRNSIVDMKTCARSQYEEAKQLQSCDCLKEDVAESIRRLYVDVPEEEGLSCLYRTSPQDWDSCPEEAMACTDVFRHVFGGPSRGCNETTKEIMMSCIERYESGSLDLSTCAPGKTILTVSQKYKQYITMACARCYHWEISRNCWGLNKTGSFLDYTCSLYWNGEEIIQCMLQNAEQLPQCRPLRNDLPGVLRALKNTLNSQNEVVCKEYAHYQKMWAEDWGCDDQSDISSGRSLEGQMYPWTMF